MVIAARQRLALAAPIVVRPGVARWPRRLRSVVAVV